MKADLVIRNARVVTHNGEFHGGVSIMGEKISAVGKNGELPRGRRMIDADGLALMPGVIDPHCHLGVNYPYDQDMDTETAAAAVHPISTGAAPGNAPTKVHQAVFRFNGV